jgi:hypothetical protein
MTDEFQVLIFSLCLNAGKQVFSRSIFSGNRYMEMGYETRKNPEKCIPFFSG